MKSVKTLFSSWMIKTTALSNKKFYFLEKHEKIKYSSTDKNVLYRSKFFEENFPHDKKSIRYSRLSPVIIASITRKMAKMNKFHPLFPLFFLLVQWRSMLLKIEKKRRKLHDTIQCTLVILKLYLTHGVE